MGWRWWFRCCCRWFWSHRICGGVILAIGFVGLGLGIDISVEPRCPIVLISSHLELLICLFLWSRFLIGNAHRLERLLGSTLASILIIQSQGEQVALQIDYPIFLHKYLKHKHLVLNEMVLSNPQLFGSTPEMIFIFQIVRKHACCRLSQGIKSLPIGPRICGLLQVLLLSNICTSKVWCT